MLILSEIKVYSKILESHTGSPVLGTKPLNLLKLRGFDFIGHKQGIKGAAAKLISGDIPLLCPGGHSYRAFKARREPNFDS